jgi:hypothetical protein
MSAESKVALILGGASAIDLGAFAALVTSFDKDKAIMEDHQKELNKSLGKGKLTPVELEKTVSRFGKKCARKVSGKKSYSQQLKEKFKQQRLANRSGK